MYGSCMKSGDNILFHVSECMELNILRKCQAHIGDLGCEKKELEVLNVIEVEWNVVNVWESTTENIVQYQDYNKELKNRSPICKAHNIGDYVTVKNFIRDGEMVDFQIGQTPYKEI
uniref:Uncharacterized protein n=1 Tax=Glossina pallidipes TaxID=7398 RepID=A0A1A9ZUW1_GLOPL